MEQALPSSPQTSLCSSLPPNGYIPVGNADNVSQSDSIIRVRAASATVEITPLAPDLFRVGLFPHGRAVDYTSVAVVPQHWETGHVTITRGPEELTIATSVARAHISLNPLRVSFSDHTGRVFAADDPDFGMGWFPLSAQTAPLDLPNVPGTLGSPVRVYKQHVANEHYFGCGERTDGLNKTGTHQLFWNIDPPRGHTILQNNLYVSIPFTLAVADGQAWGLFLDTTSRSEFDLAAENQQRSWFGVANGDLIYYVFCGPTPQDVLSRYTNLTGHTPLPPLWSLGNGQSRYSYETADELLRIARGFREHDIPCDTLYLDIDALDGYRDFTWDLQRFPDPVGLLTELREMGFHTVIIVDAGVKVDEQYPVYTEGREQDLFCKTLHGGDYQNIVWPGVCTFPDFTNSRTRKWWGAQHQPLLDVGIAGIWCDMNEPALFVPQNSTMPHDVVHPGDGNVRLHTQVHNAYGSLMVQATREGLLRLRPDQRPFVISRSGYAGVQRHALIWTGDNSSSWEHLAMSVPQLLNLGLSGVGWSGVDIGGFYGDSNGELVARWTELGIFYPFCRNHAEKTTRNQEPWVFGEPYFSICRDMLKLRQRLLPYLYTLFDECHRTGAPLLRPLFWTAPEDTTTYSIGDEFLCGDALLVAPITQPGIEYRHVYLPSGTWFHFWTGEKIEGPAHILAHAPLGQPALYVRANTAIPLWPEMNYVGQHNTDPLTLLLYPAQGQGQSTLYEDVGEGYAQEQGLYARRTITCAQETGSLHLTISEPEGSYIPNRLHTHLELHSLPNAPQSVSAGDIPLSWNHDPDQQTLSINLPTTSTSIDLTVTFST